MQDRIRTIEALSLSAWPCIRETDVDGWTVRFADGYTFRANSVQPNGLGSGDVIEKIERCEKLYASVGQPCAYKITPLAQPGELDSILESRGYRMHTPTSVQILEAIPDSLPTSHSALPTSHFLDAYASISGSSREKMPLHASIVERIPHPLIPLLIEQDDQPAACGLGVVQGEYVGLYDICTAPPVRRTGLGRQICTGLLALAYAQGATKAYLSVIQNNEPALALYRKLGFEHLYPYWYRIKD